MIKACRTLFLFLITGALFAQSPNNARDNDRRLNDLFAGINSSTGVIQNTSPQISRERSKPAWVDNPYADYKENLYIAQTGHAATRSDAEKDALSKLASVFELSVKSDFITDTVYSETILKGKLVVSEYTTVRDTIITASLMDRLIGAQIVNIWEGPRGTVYALAHINKQRTVAIYSELIRINQISIENLIRMNEDEKNTLNGIARYKLAAQIAEMNKKYANVILVAGGQIAELEIKNAVLLYDESANILKDISISLYVEGDRNNRIRNTFARVLNNEGFRIQETNSFYTLRVTLDLNEKIYPTSRYKFCKYVLNASLVDNNSVSDLFQFRFEDEEGQNTYELAEDDAIRITERRINGQFPAEFKEFLRKLIPEI
jgi:hypothetical protein